MHRRRGALRKHTQGMGYLMLLFVIALSGVLLAGLGQVWSTAVRRDKELELLFVGDEYRRAISSYRKASPDGSPQYPEKIEDLLLDKRFPNVRRHLRRAYPDPMTGRKEWGFIRAQGRIVGVYSLDPREPRKQAGFAESDRDFAGAKSYTEWRFVPTN